ncbi:low-density lipoprotein receptor-related protein 4-like [Antedon mediterranea]|uniref:low-density lipoprotein receptor-related protein 4-like n=1 Tax=Antedon mediterranea TaxID=105859 RepID=UPI003AF5217E
MNYLETLAVFCICFTVSFSNQSQDCNCEKDEFTCELESGDCECIAVQWICDGDKDCPNGQDELNCESSTCSSNQIACANGKCISKSWQCDLDNDCGDASDEIGCDEVNCEGSNKFRCDNKNCIYNRWVCDGDNDCGDSSDEVCNARTCSALEFACESGGCIPADWRCDGDRDCSDGYDEVECPIHIIPCSEGQFLCHTGVCILEGYVCDGEKDCTDGSDELRCSTNVQSCSISEFMCNDRTCINQQWKCDGDYDCDDQSDELDCPSSTCSAEQFQCTSGRCITMSWRCDGDSDCSDDSDEDNCTNSSCLANQFRCANNDCISLHKVCDGVDDCNDASDEASINTCNNIDVNYSSCDEIEGICDQICTKIEDAGVRCTCYNGYYLKDDGRNCTDVNECLIDGTCSQICTNTDGSFKCSCIDGYELRPDGKTCKALGPEPYLLFANRIDIRRIQPEHSKYTSILRGLENAIALDYHIGENLVFWSDVTLDIIKRASLDGTGIMDVVHLGLESPGGIAVDWIGRKLYWSDSGTSRIEVSNLDGSHRCILVWSGLQKPRAIATHPLVGRIFWTDWGNEPKIESAAMDGTNRNVVADTGLFWPNGLTIDYASSKLFWVDAKHHVIESANLDGSQRKAVINEGLPHPFAITLFEDNIYWTDWHTKSINTANKFTGSHLETIQSQLHFPMDIHSFHPQRQPSGVNACGMNNGGCSHLCLFNDVGFSCACETGFRLVNNTHCSNKIEESLIFSRVSDIRRISFDTNDMTDIILPLAGLEGAVALDWDEIDGWIFWSDVDDDSISRARFNGTDQEIVTDSSLSSPAGLAVDWITKKVYWTDAGNDQIEVSNYDGSKRSLLIWEDLERPRDIIVDPLSGFMFWTDWGTYPKIERAWMDGSNRVVIVNDNLTWPNGLAIDYENNKLFWVDAGTNVIGVSDFNGNQKQNLISGDLSHPFGLAIHNDRIYWTDWEDNSIYSAEKSTGLDRQIIRSNLEDLMDIHVYHKRKHKGHSSCAKNNGGCSDLCLITPLGHTCACPKGILMGPDRMSCNKGFENFLIFSKRRDIRAVSLDVPYMADVALPIYGIEHAISVDVDTVEGMVYWSDQSSKTISRAPLDGSYIEDIITEGIDIPDRLTIDTNGRKIYWTDAGRDLITVANLDGTQQRALIWENITNPRAIVLHYEAGYFYWTDWGKQMIERAWMDGSHRQPIIYHNIVWPNGLTIDKQMDKLIWNDANLNTIEMCDYNGDNRRVLLEIDYRKSHSYGLTVTGSYIYWTDGPNNGIYRAEKRAGAQEKLIIGNLSGLMDIQAINMQAKGTNKCGSNNGDCSHLCLPTPTGISCSCPNGIKLKPDQRNCADTAENFLIYTSRDKMRRISLDTNEQVDVVLPVADVLNAIAIDFDSVDEKIYYTDVHQDVIRSMDYNGLNTGDIITHNLTTADGVSVDWIARNLYWTDTGRNTLEVSRLDGTYRKVIISTNLDEPRAIAVCPFKGLLFWTDWGMRPKIERANLDGSSRRTLISSELGWPNGLTIDYHTLRIYWADAKLNRIDTSDFDGRLRTTLTNEVVHPFGITMYGDWLYWTDWQTESIELVHKSTGKGRRSFKENIAYLMDIKMISKSRQYGSNACAINNGGCSHLCLARDTGYVCACPDHMDTEKPCYRTPYEGVNSQSTKPTPNDIHPSTAVIEATLLDPVNRDGNDENNCSSGSCSSANSSLLKPNMFIIAAGLITFLVIIVVIVGLIVWRRKRKEYLSQTSLVTSNLRYDPDTDELSYLRHNSRRIYRPRFTNEESETYIWLAQERLNNAEAQVRVVSPRIETKADTNLRKQSNIDEKKPLNVDIPPVKSSYFEQSKRRETDF